MRMGSYVIAAVITLVGAFALPTDAVTTLNSGTIHGHAYAGVGALTQDNTPPDSILTPPSTGIGFSASASVYDPLYGPGGSQSTSLFTNATLSAAGTININGSGSCTGGSPGTYSYGSATGSLSFTLTTTQSYIAMLTNPATYPNYFSESVTLLDSLNNTVLAGSGPITLTPGQYHLDWNVGTFRAAGSGGFGSGSYSLAPTPEPGCFSLLPLAILALRRRAHAPRCFK
jgi:hypothetical protein